LIIGKTKASKNSIGLREGYFTLRRVWFQKTGRIAMG